ncbi:MAG TPA: maleylacetoacetate isomerase [Variovorax sp.]|nr:maleylacetoacetate isomerase [Variovorax sp.]
MKLYNYFRSSASYRVRIALGLKGLAYEYVPVHLVRGEHLEAPFASISTDTLLPLLEVENDHGNGGTERFSQSMAIIEYLDETHPEPPLLPADPAGRAHVRALAQMIACDVHPVNNLRVLKYLVRELKLDDFAKTAWYRHWVREGLQAFERQLAQRPPGRHCHGDMLTLADCCLVPQVFNAQRFDCDLQGLPRTMAVYEAAMQIEAVQRAHPSRCPDAEA